MRPIGLSGVPRCKGTALSKPFRTGPLIHIEEKTSPEKIVHALHKVGVSLPF